MQSNTPSTSRCRDDDYNLKFSDRRDLGQIWLQCRLALCITYQEVVSRCYSNLHHHVWHTTLTYTD